MYFGLFSLPLCRKCRETGENRACLHRWTESVDYALLILYAWKNVKKTVTPCEVLSRHVWHGKVNSLKYKNNTSGIFSLFNQWDTLHTRGYVNGYKETAITCSAVHSIKSTLVLHTLSYFRFVPFNCSLSLENKIQMFRIHLISQSFSHVYSW